MSESTNVTTTVTPNDAANTVKYNVEITLSDGTVTNTTVEVPRQPVNSGDVITGSDGTTQKTLAQILDLAAGAIPTTEKGVSVATLSATPATDTQAAQYVLNGNKVAVTIQGLTNITDIGDFLTALTEQIQLNSQNIAAVGQKTTDLQLVSGGTAYTGVVSGATVFDPVTNKDMMLAQALGSLNSKVSDTQLKVDGVGDSLTGLTTEVDAVNTKTAKLSADGSAYSGNITDAVVKDDAGNQLGTMGQAFKTLWDTPTDVEALQKKTAKLSDDGSEYTGDVSGAVLGQIDGQNVTGAEAVGGISSTIQKNIDNAVTAGTAIHIAAEDGSAAAIIVNEIAGKLLAVLEAVDKNGNISLVSATPDGAGITSIVKTIIGTPAANGAPTDTPSAPGEVRFDDTNGVLWRWNGTKWNGYYASEGEPLVGGTGGNTVDEFHLTLPDGSKLDYTTSTGLQLTGSDGKVRFASGASTQRMVAYDGNGTACASILVSPTGLRLNALNNEPFIVNTTASAPDNPAAVGTANEVRFDDNYMYRHTGTKWVRFPVDTTWTA